MSTNRGGGLFLQRTLRLRVMLATALTFVGLGIVICLVLPRAYSEQARESLRERTDTLARGLAHLVADGVISGGPPGEGLQKISGLLDADPDFEAAVFIGRDGQVITRWPTREEQEPAWTVAPTTAGAVYAEERFYLGVHPVAGGGSVAAIGIRTSTERLRADLENMRWLFASIFTLACVAFWVLATYLTRGIVQPLEQIRDAAISLADGEPVVAMPATGDRELDEIGRSIDNLGRARRASTLMQSPELTYLRERSPVEKVRGS